MSDKCSGRKLRVAYLGRIDFLFPLIYYAVPIDYPVKIQSYYCTHTHAHTQIYIYIYILYMHDSQIVHHNPCFNLFLLHNNSFDNQGSEINEKDIFLRFDLVSFTKTFFLLQIPIISLVLDFARS